MNGAAVVRGTLIARLALAPDMSQAKVRFSQWQPRKEGCR